MLEIIIKMLKYNLYEFKLMDSDDLLEVDVELFFDLLVVCPVRRVLGVLFNGLSS